MPKANGVELGPNSPLLRKSVREAFLKKLSPTEAQEQVMLVEFLLGKLRKGEKRSLSKGLCGKYPELMLLYAINPNKGGSRSVGGIGGKAAGGMSKAMGALADVMDLCLPVPRGPFHGLYLELKRVGEHSSESQRAMQQAFRDQGYCVLECEGVQEAAPAVVGYLTLPPSWLGLLVATNVAEARRKYHNQLTAKQRRPLNLQAEPARDPLTIDVFDGVTDAERGQTIGGAGGQSGGDRHQVSNERRKPRRGPQGG